MKNFSIIFILVHVTLFAFCQQDSLFLNLSTEKFDKDSLNYSVKLVFISNKKNEITIQLKPRYVMPNDLDGVGLRFEHLKDGCYKSLHYSDVHPRHDYDILEDNAAKMAFGDTIAITLDISSVIKTFVGSSNQKSNFIFKGQHRIMAYRLYRDKNGYSTIFSNWLYINFDELK